MIENIRISNFKRITESGIELDELVAVNYLVGENGCGKSSILEALQYFYIYSPRNKKTDIGANEVCEILEIENVDSLNNDLKSNTNSSRLRETLKNNTESIDLHLVRNSKMFHPRGHISICTDSSSQTEGLKHVNFEPIIIHCDSEVTIENRYEAFNDFAFQNSQKIEDPKLVLSFLKSTINQKREINFSELIFILNQINLNQLVQVNQIQTNKLKKLLKFLRHLLHEKDIIINTDEDESPGKDLISKFALALFYLINEFGIDLFLIEEPENHLHPKWQKLIPLLLSYIAENFDVQFIVTTHSPFIISSSSQLAQNIKEKSDFNHQDFTPPQKVYFLKDGSIASKRGEIEKDNNNHLKGRFGYWGNKLVYISSKMLGAGLMDLISPQLAINSIDAPTIIFCEGEGNDEDARLYNIIFKDLNPPAMFISARGSSQLLRTFEVIKEIKKGLAANFKVKMLRDRDHEFPTQEDIYDYENYNPGQKVLHRRAIECYLFNSESAKLWLQKHHRQIDHDLLNELDVLNANIQSEAEHQVLGNDYKMRLKDLFIFVIYGYERPDFILDQDFKEEICSLFTPESKTYQELYKVIFG